MHVALLGAVFEYLKEKKFVKVDIQKLSEAATQLQKVNICIHFNVNSLYKGKQVI